jgi:hypothetical protein
VLPDVLWQDVFGENVECNRKENELGCNLVYEIEGDKLGHACLEELKTLCRRKRWLADYRFDYGIFKETNIWAMVQLYQSSVVIQTNTVLSLGSKVIYLHFLPSTWLLILHCCSLP